MNDKKPFEGFDSLSELGEFGLIDQVAGLFGKGRSGDVVGIGDDCAVLPYKEGRSLLVTTDMLIEDRHFRHDWISAKDLGYKSLAVNISDISAMGGRPLYAFLSIGLPDTVSIGWIERFFRGTRELSEKYDLRLLGGDTTKSPGPMVINYVVLGAMDKESVLWRSSARPGDQIAVLGKLGMSGAGLKLLMEDKSSHSSAAKVFIMSHNRPELYVEEAQFLASRPEVHAMIDLSDGIQSDAGHIAKSSEVTMKIDADRIPVTDELKQLCGEHGWNPLELALASGEDYGLLFTFDAEKENTLRRDFRKRFSCEYSIIGEVADGSSELKLVKEGEVFDMGKIGFDHFKSD